MKHLFVAATLALTSLSALPIAAEAQGVVEGSRRGAAEGDRVGGPVGAVIGGAVGGAVGGAAGVLGADPGRRSYGTGLPSRTGYRARHRHHHHHHRRHHR